MGCPWLKSINCLSGMSYIDCLNPEWDFFYQELCNDNFLVLLYQVTRKLWTNRGILLSCIEITKKTQKP